MMEGLQLHQSDHQDEGDGTGTSDGPRSRITPGGRSPTQAPPSDESGPDVEYKQVVQRADIQAGAGADADIQADADANAGQAVIFTWGGGEVDG